MKIFRNYNVGRFHIVDDDTFGLRSICKVETKLATELTEVDDEYDENKLCKVCTGEIKLRKADFVSF